MHQLLFGAQGLVLDPGSPLTGCVALGSLLNLSVPCHPHPSIVTDGSTYLVRLL